MSLTITDLFCGAGGSGLGAHAAGYELVMAANHWQQAIDTHAANFPDTLHDCADISQVDPRRYRTTDVLWASPECTNHSQAKGVSRKAQSQPDLFGETLPDEAAERSRATMWDVPRFAEHHVYRAIVVENVVEAVKWVQFPAWLYAMELLGYEHQLVMLNSMHAEAISAPRAPQSRDRLYVVFNRKGSPRPDVAPRPTAWCEPCGQEVRAYQWFKKPGATWGRYRAQYLYRCPNKECRHSVVEPYALPASSAIDWSMRGKRIGDRTKPLSDKTIARIEAGLKKYAGSEFIVERRFTYSERPLTEPISTLTANDTSKALVVPVEGREGKQARPASEPMRTQSTRAETALVMPYYGATKSAKTVEEPIGTVTATDRYALVVSGSFKGEATRTDEPFTTRTTRDNEALVIPSGGTWREAATSAGEPLPARTTVETDGIAFIASLKGSQSRPYGIDEALPTVQAGGNHHGLVETMTPEVDDCSFRMLEPHEIQAAMAFGADYRVLGTRRERVRQLGNGVTPPAAEFLLRAVAETLR